MAEERARSGSPFWGRRYGIVPTRGLRYLNWRHRACRANVAGKDILDAPSGEGLGLRFLQHAKTITCLDYDQAALEVCRVHSAKNVETVLASMADMPFDDASFDVVVSLEGIEHLRKQDGIRFLSEAYRVLRDDGLLLLSCPLCELGNHSGNQFHLHEWQLPDLLEVLSFGFNLEEQRSSNAIGPVVWLKLRKKVGDPSPKSWVRQYSESAARQVYKCKIELTDWLQQLSTDRGASLFADGHPSFLPTTFSVLGGELAGGSLPDVTAILKQSQMQDGLFSPGDISAEELGSHSAKYLRLQATYFAIHALDALGQRPDRPVSLVSAITDPTYMRGWFDGGPWQNPWLHSNNIMFAMTFLQTDYEWHGEEKSLDALDAALDYLDERQDPSTGLWQPDDRIDIRNAVYAAYHFFPYYFWRSRRPNHIESIIDSTLSIQSPDGLFGGGACEDLDAVHTLVMMNLVSSHRDTDVRDSLERCLWRLLQLQNPDGGFSNYAANPQQWKSWKRKALERAGVMRYLPEGFRNRGVSEPPTWCYSGWKQLECPYGVSDTWGSWFRPLAIKLITDHYPGLAGTFEGNYRRLPGLGWHDADRIRESEPQAAKSTLLKANS